MIHVGIDPSLSATGIVGVSSDNEVLLNTTIGSNLKGVERLADLKAKLSNVTQAYDVELRVVLEGYSYGSPGRRESLAEWGGVLRLSLHEMGIEYIEIPPTSLKKFLTNNGNANKLMVATTIQKVYQVEFGGNDNEFDAYGLAQMGRAIAGKSPVHAYQADVLFKLKLGEKAK